MTNEYIKNFTDKMMLGNNIILQALKEFSQDMAKLKIKIDKKEVILVPVSSDELEILLQSLGARKKLLRGKIRNNYTHMANQDKPDWSEADYQKAIKRRKVQLADADILMTRISGYKD